MTSRPLTPAQATVYQAILAAARAGLTCPKNEELCDRLGAASTATPGYILKSLQGFGLIELSKTGRNRRVTLPQLGLSTR